MFLNIQIKGKILLLKNKNFTQKDVGISRIMTILRIYMVKTSQAIH